ncbi:MAG: type II toxin-antitoxin system Phd/YefM family antitoxin [Desulfobacteraceae bacterium]|jgi:prevent-host-death family protein|nr:type II toxin-antitoxin system Phd/YefM family antitoxin [Desulfobacteraceae bacterium]
MSTTYTLSEAKAKLSELIGRVHFGGEKFTITRKGKPVAIVSPIGEKAADEAGEGLIRARGALAGPDEVIDEMLEAIYTHRDQATDRETDI